PIAAGVRDRYEAVSVSDGAGGTIVVWREYHPATGLDVYGQRINGFGVPQWAPDGVPIAFDAGDQVDPVITSDGAGGVFVAWVDARNGTTDILAQRVSAGGALQWTPLGVPVSTAPGEQVYPDLAADGAGGVTIAWEDRLSNRIYAQRLDGQGVRQWAANGVPVCPGSTAQTSPKICSDDAGGLIVAWSDGRPGNNGVDIYSQRLDASGAPDWGSSGAVVTVAGLDQVEHRIARDGSGGALLVWMDQRSGDWDVYAQRLSGAGSPLWQVGGLPVGAVVGAQTYPSMVPDGSGGLFAAWQDTR